MHDIEVPVYVCQRCGTECDDGDRDTHGLHAYCGGELDPNGSVWVSKGRRRSDTDASVSGGREDNDDA